ncbi:hypothetical protein [Actinomadura hibisca]|uniref:hypothetical protein n=1 Tax=Actinomadura hibisca TaxID=68565 RepID=UPI000831A799|nr:hypothetical protein [Actinomadura hibisca]
MASRLVWAPDPRRDGLRGFARIEDDRAGSHPGVPHIRALGTMWRFDIHPCDVDTLPDRQRQEVAGMRIGGRERRAAEGETWRFSWSWYLTGALRATTSFTHVHQQFAVGTGRPVLVISLRRRGGRDTVELNALHAGVLLGAADLAPLRGRWSTVELEIRYAAEGRVRWRVADDAGRVVADVARDGLATWYGNAGVAPKWGIYRSSKDAARLPDAHLLLKDLRAHQR